MLDTSSSIHHISLSHKSVSKDVVMVVTITRGHNPLILWMFDILIFKVSILNKYHIKSDLSLNKEIKLEFPEQLGNT